MCPMPDVIERPVLLRAVTLPPSMGTEDDYPPTVGLYKNVILKYESNKHVYVYSSDGIPVYLESDAPVDERAFKPFPSSVDTTHTTEAFLNSILALNAPVGMAFLGTVTLTDMPAELTQEEVEVYIYSDYVVYAIMRSTDVAPYQWWCSSCNYQGWQPAGGGSTKTVFYASSSETGTTRHIYKDESFTIPATAQEVSDASENGGVVLRYFNINTPTQFNEVILANVWQSPSDNDYQFVFIGDGTSHTYAADALTDNSFYCSNAPFMFGNRVQTTGTSTTDVMSQNATTEMIFADPSTRKNIAIGENTVSSGDGSVAIGSVTDTGGAQATGSKSVAIGDFALATGARSVAIGKNSNADYADSVALGSGAQPTSNGEVSVKPLAGRGYNVSDYRLITGVHDPVNAHDAATKGYVDSATPTVVQSLGDSETDVMSQKATTTMVYPVATNRTRIRMGEGSSAVQDNTIAIGYHAEANDNDTTAIGYYAAATNNRNIAIGRRSYADGLTGAIAIGSSANSGYVRASGGASIALGSPATASADGAVAIGLRASASADGAVAIGPSSTATLKGVVSIGDIPSSYQSQYGYSNTAYRRLTGLYDGQSEHDAATKGQLDTAIVNGGTMAPTTSTVGAVGTLYSYVNSGTPEIYMCTAVSGNVYTWTKAI